MFPTTMQVYQLAAPKNITIDARQHRYAVPSYTGSALHTKQKTLESAVYDEHWAVFRCNLGPFVYLPTQSYCPLDLSPIRCFSYSYYRLKGDSVRSRLFPDRPLGRERYVGSFVGCGMDCLLLNK